MNVESLKVGMKMKMRIPESQMGNALCHIEAIIADPANEIDECNMVVYRYWSKFRKRWFWKVHSYWHLAIYNDWECKINENT